MPPHTRRRCLLSLLLIALMVLAGSAAALAQGPGRFTAVPLRPERVIDVGPTRDGAAPGKRTLQSADGLVSVIVKLDLAPLASYRGGIPGYAPTNPQLTGTPQLDLRSVASQRYLGYLTQRLQAFEVAALAAIPQAHITARYRVVYGGAALLVPAAEVDQLARLPGVVAVQPDRLLQLTTDRSPQFIGAPTLWRALGGPQHAGEGVVVGVLDTGIWPEHPSFADDGSYPPPPPWWRGVCAPPNDTSPPIACTNKLIGARVFLDAYKALVGLGPGEYDSARDNEGHGTHTASTAAGNASVAAEIFGVPRGQVSGIAPRAHIAAYKVCGAEGCLSSDTLAAVEQAVADGVNVINFSISGGEQPYRDPVELAFLDAYAAGVFVAASAGNDGPAPGTVNHAGGWVTTVAASTHDRQFSSTLTLRAGQDRLELIGASITAGIPEFAPVVTSTDELCLEPFPPGSVAGAIVACQRGVIARVQKGYNVLQGGAVGMILYNPTLADVETDNHWLPTVHLPDGAPLVEFLSHHTNVVASFTTGTATRVRGDILAAFSSRGPAPDGALIKPDLTAPGVQILAGHTPTPSSLLGGPPGELFQAIAGTSMSAPHVAGAGALLKALHPNWTPGQIKSALMTSATFEQVLKEDEATPATPFDIGSGRLDLTRAGNPGLTFDVTAEQYAAGSARPWALNYPSIMIATMPGRFSISRMAHSELDRDSTWDITTTAPPGVTISVNPARLAVPARGYAGFTVTIEARNVPDGTYFGSIDLTYKNLRVHLPVAFERKQPGIALAKNCDPDSIHLNQSTRCTISVVNSQFAPTVASITDVVPRGLDVIADSVIGATLDDRHNTLTFNGHLPSATGTITVAAAPGQSPAGYFSLSQFPGTQLPCSSLCDETGIILDLGAVGLDFSYGGVTYSTMTMVSNGYLIVGDGTTLSFINQRLPDPAPPNNVIAPYWTDLDLDGTAPDDGGSGTWYFAVLTDTETNIDYLVAEWKDVAQFGIPGSAHSFQIWIRAGSSEIFMVYGPTTATASPLTVGAENQDGSVGDNYYVDLTPAGIDGEGTAPIEGDELAVITEFTPATYAIRFEARGVRRGIYLNTVEMTSNIFEGTSLASAEVRVTRRR